MLHFDGRVHDSKASWKGGAGAVLAGAGLATLKPLLAFARLAFGRDFMKSWG
jgi:hypothetical protein